MFYSWPCFLLSGFSSWSYITRIQLPLIHFSRSLCTASLLGFGFFLRHLARLLLRFGVITFRVGNKPDTLHFDIAFATLIAKPTPILLFSILFSNAVMWKIYEACMWLAVAALSYMVLVLMASFWVECFYLRASKLLQRFGLRIRRIGT